MKPENGMFRWHVTGTQSDLEHEKETIAWCKKLLRREMASLSRAAVEEMLMDATRNVAVLESHLDEWRKIHFDHLRDQEGA